MRYVHNNTDTKRGGQTYKIQYNIISIINRKVSFTDDTVTMKAESKGNIGGILYVYFFVCKISSDDT